MFHVGWAPQRFTELKWAKHFMNELASSNSEFAVQLLKRSNLFGWKSQRYLPRHKAVFSVLTFLYAH
jgi:hypothetical protein